MCSCAYVLLRLPFKNILTCPKSKCSYEVFIGSHEKKYAGIPRQAAVGVPMITEASIRVYHDARADKVTKAIMPSENHGKNGGLNVPDPGPMM